MGTLQAALATPKIAALLDTLPLGVLIIDADFRIAHVNPVGAPTFDAVPGGIVGRDFSEVLHVMRDQQFADDVVRIFRNTLATGANYASTESSSLRGRPSSAFFEWRVERITMDDGSHGLACYFRGVSRETQTQQLGSFRVALTDALRPLTKPADVQAAAANLLGEYLMASAVVYADVDSRPDGDYYIVRHHYRAGNVRDFSGEYRAREFGEGLFDELRGGRTVVVNDVQTDPRFSVEEKRAHAALGVRAYVKVPMIKDGRHLAQISALQCDPRFWSPIEVTLLEETAERTWAAAERARAEARVHASELDSARQRRLYEAILSNTPDLAYIFDLQHRFIYANEGLLKMWGKTWEEAIGKTCLELGYEPWHAEMHDREIDQVVATKKPIRGDVPFTGTFGRRTYDYIFVPVFGPNGEVEAVAGTTRDVTEIKESERRKDEFLAVLAHELRNPLAPIRNAIHIMALSAQTDSTRQLCEMMERQVNHMVRLVDDLMEISRISRGVIELRREHTTLEALIRSAVDTSTPAISAQKHKLVLGLPAEPVTLHGDPVRLSQVISNLLNNAAKYTQRGGRIWLSAERHGDEVFIRVRDNGIGIAADMLPRIFDMFVQVKDAALQAQGGLGIGLSLVKHLVEMHGGKVSATSGGPGQGSEFCIVLPCVKAEPAQAANADLRVAGTQVQRRVMIVDDNEDAAYSLALVIRRLGAEVEVANDGVRALELMPGFRPDIVLLDLGMPVMNGFEVAAQVRTLPGLEKVKLVALTGWGQPEDRERTRVAGFDHHLIKPAPLPELQKLLASLK